MTHEIVHTVEKARGCGYRKPSKTSGIGIYLIGLAETFSCGRLPIPLGVCPCCSAGIKPARGWTWIEPQKLLAPLERPCGSMMRLAAGGFAGSACKGCAAGSAIPEGRHGLLWVGEKFYPSPHDFVRESRALGLSRKIAALPRGFELGQTVVYLAHRHAVLAPAKDGAQPEAQPGIFMYFRPIGVDIVIDPDATEAPDNAVRLAEQIGEGARIVQVTRDADTQTDLWSSEPEELDKPR